MADDTSDEAINTNQQFANSLPELESLILTNNLIKDLSALKPLQYCKKLKRLSLMDNPVQKKEHYRLYVIHLIPSLCYLDFKKVKKQVRSHFFCCGTHKQEIQN